MPSAEWRPFCLGLFVFSVICQQVLNFSQKDDSSVSVNDISHNTQWKFALVKFSVFISRQLP